MRKRLEDRIERDFAYRDIEEGRATGNKLQETSGKLILIGQLFSMLGTLAFVITFIAIILKILF